jgi:Fe-S cluster assembly protein SufD
MNVGLSAEERAPYFERFTELVDETAQGATQGWLTPSRKGAFDAFLAQGWPTKKQEDWRFTDVAPILEVELPPAIERRTPLDLSIFDESLVKLGEQSPHRLIFVDGLYGHGAKRRELHPAGLTVRPISSAAESPELRAHLGRHLRNSNAFAALNTAFMRDGAFIHIPPGFHAEAPIYLVHLAATGGSTSFPRTLIVADAGSQAAVVEVYLGARGQAALCNAATEIVLGTGAGLAYHTVQQASAEGFHVGHVAVTQASGSALSVHSLSLAGRIVRNDIQTVLSGEDCTCNLDGVYLAAGQDHIDNQTTIDHVAPRSTSREDYRGAIEGAGHAVFSGRIIVRPKAEKTDAQQTNRNLLLSDTAQINSKPQLEIFTSDVKCSHGATAGRLDPDALFYLRARGIGKKDADRILIRAFLQQGLERIASTTIRAELEAALDRRIDQFIQARPIQSEVR